MPLYVSAARRGSGVPRKGISGALPGWALKGDAPGSLPTSDSEGGGSGVQALTAKNRAGPRIPASNIQPAAPSCSHRGGCSVLSSAGICDLAPALR